MSIDRLAEFADWKNDEPTCKAMVSYVLQHPTFTAKYDEFNAISSPATELLVTDFNRKKRAYELGTVTRKKTGSLDIAKLPQYKINDDIFKRRTNVSKGKNHSFDIMIDWSSSFEYALFNSICQAIILADFARRIQAPFRVVAFLSAQTTAQDDKAGVLSKHRLVNFLNSSMSTAEYNKARRFLWFLAKKYDYEDYAGRREIWPGYQIRSSALFPGITEGQVNQLQDFYSQLASIYTLYGTPLNSGLVELRALMRQEAKPNQIQNLVIMTDGASDTIDMAHPTTGENLQVTNPSNEYMDPLTKRRYKWTEADAAKFAPDVRSSWNSRARMGYEMHLILKTFDWGNVNKIMFFIESSSRGTTVRAFKDLMDAHTAESLIAARMHFGWRRPLNVSNYGHVDQLILVDPAMYKPAAASQSEVKLTTAKQIAQSFAKDVKLMKNLQIIARRLATIITGQYALNADFLTEDQEFCYATWADVKSGTFRSSALDKFLEEERKVDEFEDETDDEEEYEDE